MKKALFLFMLLLVLASCDNYMKLKIKFDGKTNIMPRSAVMYEDTVIGTVERVETDEKSSTVYVLINPDYRKRMNTGTMFFRVKEKESEKVMVLFNDKDEYDLLVDGQAVDGMEEFMYHVAKVAKGITEKVREFFQSKEWTDFQSSITEKINRAYETAKDEFGEDAKEVREDIDKFIKDMDEKYGKDIGEKIREFADSLLKEEDKK